MWVQNLVSRISDKNADPACSRIQCWGRYLGLRRKKWEQD